MENGLQFDKQWKKAVELLNDPAAYKKVLQPLVDSKKTTETK